MTMRTHEGWWRALPCAAALAAGLALAAPGAAPARAQEATPAACAPMTPEEGRALTASYLDALDARDVAAIAALVSPDATITGGTSGGGDAPEGVAALHERVFAAFPDHDVEVEAIVSDGDEAYALWSGSGANQGDYRGTPATGEPRAWSAISRLGFDCGRIADLRILTDQAAVLGLDGPLAAGSPATPTADAAPASCAENDAAAMRAALDSLWANGWNGRDADTYAAVFSDGYVHRHHAGPDTVGLEAGKARVDALVAAAPDLEIAWGDIVVDGDLAAASWTISGTLDGVLFGEQGAGAPFAYDGANVFRFACGEIVETWSEGDVLGAAAQIAAAG